MNKKIVALLLALTLVAGTSVPALASVYETKVPENVVADVEKKSGSEVKENMPYKEDEVIITYSDDQVDTDAVEEAVESGDTKGLTDAEETLADLGVTDQETVATQTSSDETTSVVTLPEDISVDKAIQKLENTDGIDKVQKNYIYYVAEAAKTSTDDPKAGNQYYLNNVNLKEAWSQSRADNSTYNKSGKPVTVAVVDTGITYEKKYRDEDLKDVADGGNIYYEYAYDGVTGKKLSEKGNSAKKEMGPNWLDDTKSYVDYMGHGTAVTSIIAGKTNNKKGISGTSFNGRVLPVNVFSCAYATYDHSEDDADATAFIGECTTATLVKAYTYILKNADKLNIKVINMSLGGRQSGDDKALQKKIEEAYAKNIVTIAASGNIDNRNFYGGEKLYPASLTHVVSVAATDKNHKRASFSEYNSVVDVCAPGKSICAVYNVWYLMEPHNGSKPYFSYAINNYANVEGTSFATPIVSGIAALMYAANPKLTAANAIKYLGDSAIDLGPGGKDSYYGSGEVNAYHAVMMAKNSASGHKWKRSASSTSLNVTCSGNDGLKQVVKRIPISSATVSTYRYVYDGKAKKPSVNLKFSDGVNVKKVSSGNAAYTITYPSERKKVGTYTITISGKDFYSGTKKVKFKISPVATKISSLKGKSKGLKVTWAKKTAEVSGYEIRYSKYSSMSKAKTVKISSAKTTSKTIKKLSKKKKYYVQVRTYKNVGKYVYRSSWSAKKSVKTK